MNQEIKMLGTIMMTFTWFDEDKFVYVKYFMKKTGFEIESFEQISKIMQNKCIKERLEFEKANPRLFMYSY